LGIGDWGLGWGMGFGVGIGDLGIGVQKKIFFLIFNDFNKISIFRFFLPFSVFWKWQKK